MNPTPEHLYSPREENQKNEFLTYPRILTLPGFNPPLEIAVFASGTGTNLEAIATAINEKRLDAIIKALIVNNPASEVIKRAERLGIPYFVHDHRNFDNRSQFESAIVNTLSKLNVEGIVMAGWMRICSNVLLNSYPNKIINIHPSLLPSFSGVDAIGQAIDRKVKITGCSVHFVTSEVDAGPLLIQSAVPILPTDTKESLTLKIHQQEHIILPQGIALAGQIWRSNK